MNDKLIFLDIDGVLNNQIFYAKRKEHFQTTGVDLVEGTHAIDPINMAHLNDLCGITEAKVVISSTWRLGKSVDELREIFDEAGFKGDIIGKTPRLNYKETGDSVERGAEIRYWMKETANRTRHNGLFKDYVILDDDSDMLYNQRNHFVWVDPYAGLTRNTVYKAVQTLM